MHSLDAIIARNVVAVKQAAMDALENGRWAEYAAIVKANPDLFPRRARG